MSIHLAFLPATFAGLVAAGLVIASPAMAQTAPATAAAPAVGAAVAAAVPTRRDMVVEHRIAELHSKLKITAAEQKAFDDFAQAMRDNVHRMDAALSDKRAGAATASAVDQMKSYASLAQSHAEEVNRLVGPFGALYDALTPAQKKLADQSFRDFSNNPRMAAMRG